MARKTEILFYYESRQNPNGDPGFDNQPRLMPDGTILVTDVRVKRTMRDYAKASKGKSLFADFGKDGSPVPARQRAEEIAKDAKDNDKDTIAMLLKSTFDVPLFGALVPYPKDPLTGKPGSQKLTGPMQFSIGRSVNKVNIINPSITSRFVGDEKKGRHATMGSFYAVEYALIKTSASVNPANLGERMNDPAIKRNFEDSYGMIAECLWHGTNDLVSRSKYPQSSVLYIEVAYKDRLYNDLPYLVSEKDKHADVAEMSPQPFVFDKLAEALNERKDHIEGVRVKRAKSVEENVEGLVGALKGIDFTMIP